MPRRTALFLLIVATLIAALWGAARLKDKPRATAPPSVGESTDAPARVPTEPRAFAAWLRTADPAARRQAAASLRKTDATSEALIAAVCDQLDEPGSGAWDFLEQVGPSAFGAVEAFCLRMAGTGGEDAQGAAIRSFEAAMNIGTPDDRRALLLACLSQPGEALRYEAAERVRWAQTDGTTPYEVGPPLQRALACALVAAPIADLNAWGPEPLRELLGDVLVGSLDGDGAMLRDLASDESPEVRRGAALVTSAWALSLGDVSDGGDPRASEGTLVRERTAVDVLSVLISDRDVPVRRSALSALGSLADADVAVPIGRILDILQDLDEAAEVRATAALVLAGRADLRAHLHDPSPEVRAAVLATFANHADEAPPRGEFAALLADPDARVREAAARALGTCAPDADGRRKLLDGLDDPSEPVRLACCRALRQGGLPPVETIPHLQKWLSEGSDAERDVALEMIPALGPSAAPLEPTLLSVLPGIDPEIRSHLVQTLAGIPGQNPRTLETLITCAGDPASSVRGAAVAALVRRFPDYPAARDALFLRLSDEDEGVAVGAAAHLAERGDHLEEALKACARVVRDRDAPFWVRDKAIETIGRFGDHLREAAQALLDALDPPPSLADKALVQAIASLPGLADVTVPALARKAGDGNKLALRALDRLGSAAEPYLATALGRMGPERREAFQRAWAALRAEQRGVRDR